ncbi:sensor histidine kinase [Shewanella colwelliana]|nr:PhnD/SsuA/transferrin family substrate-binding protein [Shewanella colwelliana]
MNRRAISSFCSVICPTLRRTSMTLLLVCGACFAVAQEDASHFTNATDTNDVAEKLGEHSVSTTTIITPLRVGALAFAAPDAVYKRWAPTLARVSQETGIPLELIPLTPNELVEKVSREELDFIIGNALITVAFKKDYGVSHLLTLMPRNQVSPEHAVGSALIAKQSLNIRHFQDLMHLKVVSSDPNAFGGFQILAGEMVKQGLNPLTDLKHLSFVGFPQDKLLDQVLDGRADVAILPTCVLESALARHLVPPNALHILLPKTDSDIGCQTSSQLYPSYAFSKLGKTDHKAASAIVRALLAITAQDTQAVAGHYKYWSVPVNDSHVFALLKNLQRWPFVTNWQRLAEDATPWALLIAIGLLLGYFHHLRVKRLVVKRTKALSDEMAQHKHTQKALFEQQKQFYKAQRVLLTGEMASGIAHELNQPLAGIRYLTQGCIYRLDETQTDLKQALNKTILQVDRAQSTIKRFRQFCQQPSVYQNCDLKDLIDETLNLMQPDFKRMKLVPQLALWPITVSVDQSLMQQVLVNLIRNALDAMETSHKPRLQISVLDDAGQVHIVITDSGVGLNDDALQRLFFPFETSKANGLGLGMVVCKRIVEEHGGKIRAFNNQKATTELDDLKARGNLTFISAIPPKGLTVLVTLPLKGQIDV